jgi:tetratricopeptide (TPR) repeat protein
MRPSPRPLLVWLALALLGAAAPVRAAAGVAAAHLAAGDEWWARRAEGAPAGAPGRAAPGPVGQAIAAYEQAVEADPADLEARWKLLWALYFEGEHVARGADGRREVFDRGRRAAEAALDRLAARLGGRAAYDRLAPAARAERLAGVSEAVAIHCWAAVHWGLWGDAFGRLAAARQGVAGKVRDYGETALALDPAYEQGASHRVLGRLHALAPKVPFVTGWIDRGRAVAELERAVAVGPDEPLNRLYLAEALLEHRPDRRAEALGQLRTLLERPPRRSRPVEDADARRQARELLEGPGGGR